MPLPSRSFGLSVVLKPSDCQFRKHWVDVKRQNPPVKTLSGDKSRSRMGETIQDCIANRAAGEEDSLNRFQRLLGKATGNVLLKPVEYLLDVNPYISRTDIL